MDTIKQAIEYADAPQNDGAGYTLRVHTSDGIEVEVDVYGGPCEYVLRLRAPAAPEHDGTPVFFNPQQVTRVDVLF